VAEYVKYAYVVISVAQKNAVKCISCVAMFRGNGMEIGSSKW
jgi:hypothetical protein